MKKRTGKTLAVLLSLVMCAALLPAQTHAAVDMQADSAPLTVYTSVIGFAGQEWWVIGYNGSGVPSQDGTATLLLKSSSNPYGNTAFRRGSDTKDDPSWTLYSYNGLSAWYEGSFTQPSDYADSTLQRRMEEIASTFPGKELALINARTLSENGDSFFPMGGEDVPGQKLWPLSCDEYIDWDLNRTPARSFGKDYWLRSCSGVDGAMYVRLIDYNPIGIDGYYTTFAVRPAFNLNLSSVLFTSAAAGGKSSAAVGSGLVSAQAPTGALKFTAKDASQTLDVTATEAQAAQTDSTLTFGYRNATTGTNQYVSCVLMNSGGEVAYYGKLKDSSSNASGDLNIPLAGVTNGTYTLQIFSEEANGDNYTDFCSEPVSMTLEVTDGVGTVSGFRGTVLDTIAPVLSEGSALRTASAAADVSFTSDEAGTYYWQVDGTAPASADALVNGGASSETLVSGENAKELTGLAEGPHTVYIAAKDASDNVSNLLTISIPAPEQPAPVIYSVKEHFGTYTGSGALTVRIDADYSKFVRLKCDGIVVDPANYTVAQGSTIITLQDRYLKTLGNGTHWFVAEYTDGYSQGIRLDVNVPNVPQTGDNSSMQGWLAVMLGSALGILCLAVWRKRKKIKGTW